MRIYKSFLQLELQFLLGKVITDELSTMRSYIRQQVVVHCSNAHFISLGFFPYSKIPHIAYRCIFICTLLIVVSFFCASFQS